MNQLSCMRCKHSRYYRLLVSRLARGVTAQLLLWRSEVFQPQRRSLHSMRQARRSEREVEVRDDMAEVWLSERGNDAHECMSIFR